MFIANALAAVLAAQVPSTAPAPARASDPATRAAWIAIVDAMQRWGDAEYPEATLENGRPTPNADRVADESIAAIEARRRKSDEFLAQLSALDAAKLAGDDLLGWQLLTRQLREGKDGHRFRTFLMPVGGRGGPQQDIPQMADRVPLRTAEDLEHYVHRLATVPQRVADVQALMELGIAEHRVPAKATMKDVPAQFDAVVRGRLETLRAPLARLPDSMPAARQEALRAEADAAIARILERLAAMRTFLAERYLPACRDTVGASALPDGAAYYDHALRVHTTTDMDAKAIHRTGLAEVERIRAEMLAVIRKTDWYVSAPDRGALADDDLFAAFVRHLRTDAAFYARSEEQLLQRYRDVCKQIDAKLPGLFGTLPRNSYGVHAVPKFMAPTQTTAYYQPGSLRAGNPGWFCANTYALDQRPLYEIVPLSLHEAVPGHHLQISIAQELPDQPEFRRDMHFTAFVEGWALYAERLGIEMGFFEKDPYSDFGRLTYEMWRANRLVVDTGLHAFGWTKEQAMDFMKRNTALSDLNIEREVDRYIDWPGQACGYKIGELRIRAMRAKAEKELGAAFDVRAFHDAVLGAGAIPLDVLQARIDAWIAARRAAGQASATQPSS